MIIRRYRADDLPAWVELTNLDNCDGEAANPLPAGLYHGCAV